MWQNIVIILLSVLLNGLAQILLRKGMLIVGSVGLLDICHHIGALVTNIWLWIAMICYAISLLMWLSVLSKVEVSYAYPFLSVGYIVAMLAGYFLFNENVSPV